MTLMAKFGKNFRNKAVPIQLLNDEVPIDLNALGGGYSEEVLKTSDSTLEVGAGWTDVVNTAAVRRMGDWLGFAGQRLDGNYVDASNDAPMLKLPSEWVFDESAGGFSTAYSALYANRKVLCTLSNNLNSVHRHTGFLPVYFYDPLTWGGEADPDMTGLWLDTTSTAGPDGAAFSAAAVDPTDIISVVLDSLDWMKLPNHVT